VWVSGLGKDGLMPPFSGVGRGAREDEEGDGVVLEGGEVDFCELICVFYCGGAKGERHYESEGRGRGVVSEI